MYVFFDELGGLVERFATPVDHHCGFGVDLDTHSMDIFDVAVGDVERVETFSGMVLSTISEEESEKSKPGKTLRDETLSFQ